MLGERGFDTVETFTFWRFASARRRLRSSGRWGLIGWIGWIDSVTGLDGSLDCVAWVLLLAFSSLWHAFGTGLDHTEPHTGQRPSTMTGADDRGREGMGTLIT